MKVKVIREEIIEGLQKSSNIIPAKTGAAFLRTIWLKAENSRLRIMSTDSNLEFLGSYQADIEEEGLAGVQGRLFYDLVRKLPAGEMNINLDKNSGNLLLSKNKKKYKLPTNDVTWFQDFSEFPEKETVLWSGDFLSEIIDRVAYCISDEDEMEAINCICITKSKQSGMVDVCGLNGHQFALVRFMNDDILSLAGDAPILIKKKYLMELKKWLGKEEVEMGIDNKRLFFRTADKLENFSLPLSFYQYPDYYGFLSKLDTPQVSTLIADREELMESLDRILVFNTENQRCTYFVPEGEELVLFSQGQDIGEASETLNVSYTGALNKIAFPTRNMIELLGHVQSDKVIMTFTGKEGPCGVKGEDDADYQVIIMPMKIVEDTYYTEEEVS